jgi:hypothetical protein
VNHKDITSRVDKLLEEKQEEKVKLKSKESGIILPIDEWIKNQKFTTTKDIAVPDLLLDQVIGQDKAVDIVNVM